MIFMAVQILTNSGNEVKVSQIYQLLKNLENSFFGSVELVADGSNACYILCTSSDETAEYPAVLRLIGTSADPTAAGVVLRDVNCYHSDGSLSYPYPTSGMYITNIGICNNGVIIGTANASGAIIVGKDHYGDYAYLQAGLSSNKPTQHTSYAYDTNSLHVTYDTNQQTDREQTNLAHVLVPIATIGGHQYNYFKDVYYASVRGSLYSDQTHVIIGDDHYLTYCTAYFIKD